MIDHEHVWIAAHRELGILGVSATPQGALHFIARDVPADVPVSARIEPNSDNLLLPSRVSVLVDDVESRGYTLTHWPVIP